MSFTGSDLSAGQLRELPVSKRSGTVPNPGFLYGSSVAASRDDHTNKGCTAR